MEFMRKVTKRILQTVFAMGLLAAGGFVASWAFPEVVDLAKAHYPGKSGKVQRVASAGADQEVQLAQAAPKGARDGMTAGASTTTTTKTFGGWTVVCSESGDPPRRVCSANFRIINKQNNSNVLVWVVGFNNEGAVLSEFLTLTDVLIQPGVVVTLGDSEPVRADFVECTTRGCKARLEMTPELIGRLKENDRAVVAMTRIDGQVIRFQMEIPGVDEALTELGV